MRPVRWLPAAALAILLSSSPAGAEVILTLGEGRATLRATDATIAEILSAWARTGHTTIVNLDKLDTARVTLTLEDVPERMALDVILRSAAGFVAIPRATDAIGVSRIARIVILARTGSSADAARNASVAAPLETPAQDADAPTTFTEPATVEHLIGPDGQPVPDDQEGLDPSTQPPPPTDVVEPSPADALRPDGGIVPADQR
jgi:hypothetical protein